MGYRYRLLEADEIRSRSPEIIAIYRDAFSRLPYSKSVYEVDEFSDSLSQDAAHAVNLQFVAAVDPMNQRIAGFAYGRKVSAELPWCVTVSRYIDEGAREDWLSEAYQLVQIAVLPSHQRRGIGGALHDRLFERSPYHRAVLTTIDQESPARNFYQNRGWQIITRGIEVPLAKRRYCLMGLINERGIMSASDSKSQEEKRPTNDERIGDLNSGH